MKHSFLRSAPTIIAILLLVVAGTSSLTAQWTQSVIRGPGGSVGFGTQVVLLSNGNYWVSDPLFDPGTGIGTGAVFLFDGATNQEISRITGSQATDHVGGAGISQIGNDKIVVCSPDWNGSAGAATWMDNRGGVNAVVDHKNSLVGTVAGSRVGEYCAMPLFNGNYVVVSPSWRDIGRADLGAVTWGGNTAPAVGYVSNQNSLVGTTPGDRVGQGFVTILRNGNYVVRSPNWTYQGAVRAGAATWGNGATGTSGRVSAVNSIIGRQADDSVGSRVQALANSNYIVASPNWANGSRARAGAVTLGDGSNGTFGPVSRGNSIVGDTAGDQVGSRVLGLTNSNFVVLSPSWDDSATGNTDVGAITWGKGTFGVTGSVNASNSLLGTNKDDRVGSGTAVPLANGNYAVASPYWYKERGAVTFGEGSGGNSNGYVSDRNSMVGASGKDHVGSGGLISLAGGNYAFTSPDWDSPWATDVGSATWCDGSSGCAGIVDQNNSLVGSTTGDQVGSAGLIGTGSGNWVVFSPLWENGGIDQAGAATFVIGGGPTGGVVSTGNSIYGTTPGDRVGIGKGTTLGNDHYAVSSPYWDSRGVDSDGFGAVTWGDGINGTTGPVSAATSIVGGAPGDRIGSGTYPAISGGPGFATRLFDQSLLIHSPYWESRGVDNDGLGAVTWFDGAGPTIGVVDASNSIVGSQRGDLVGSCGAGCFAAEALQNGGFSLFSPFWDNRTIADAGAVTLGAPRGTVVGPITSANSVRSRVGGTGFAGSGLFVYPWLTPSGRLLVGLPFESRVVAIGP